MKKVKPMKHNVFLAAMLVSSLAIAQAPAPKPSAEAPKAPAKEAAKPAVAEVKPVVTAVKPAAEAKKSRRSEDARHCLEQPDNNAVIKCAEAFL
jgi:hypothetical protein